MYGHYPEEIVEPPHSFGQRWSSENPAAAQAGEAIGLGQATCGYEIRPEMECGPAGRIETGFEINLIDEHMRAEAASDIAYELQRGIKRAHSGGIMQVGDDDQAGARRDGALHFARIEFETVFEAAWKATNFRAQITGHSE